MKNYQVIFEVLKLYGAFMMVYLFIYYCIPWNLEKNSKKISEKFRNFNVKFFSIAISGFFPVYGGLRLFEAKITSINLFIYYYLAVLALVLI